MEKTEPQYRYAPFNTQRDFNQGQQQQARFDTAQGPMAQQPLMHGHSLTYPHAPLTFTATQQSYHPYPWLQSYIPIDYQHPLDRQYYRCWQLAYIDPMSYNDLSSATYQAFIWMWRQEPRSGQADEGWYHAYIHKIDGSKWISQIPAPVLSLTETPALPLYEGSLVDYLVEKPASREKRDLSQACQQELGEIYQRLERKESPLLQSLQGVLSRRLPVGQSLRLIQEYLEQMQCFQLSYEFYDELGQLTYQKIRMWAGKVMNKLKLSSRNGHNDLLNMLRFDQLCRPKRNGCFIEALQKCFSERGNDQEGTAQDLLQLIHQSFFEKEIALNDVMYRWMTLLLSASNEVISNSASQLVLNRKVYTLPSSSLQKVSLFCQAIEPDLKRRSELTVESLRQSGMRERISEYVQKAPPEHQTLLKNLIQELPTDADEVKQLIQMVQEMKV